VIFFLIAYGIPLKLIAVFYVHSLIIQINFIFPHVRIYEFYGCFMR